MHYAFWRDCNRGLQMRAHQSSWWAWSAAVISSCPHPGLHGTCLLEESLLVASLLFPGSHCTTSWGSVSPPFRFPVASSALPWRWVRWAWTQFQRGVQTDQQKHPLHYLPTSTGNHAFSTHEYRSPGSGHHGQGAPNMDPSVEEETKGNQLAVKLVRPVVFLDAIWIIYDHRMISQITDMVIPKSCQVFFINWPLTGVHQFDGTLEDILYLQAAELLFQAVGGVFSELTLLSEAHRFYLSCSSK